MNIDLLLLFGILAAVIVCVKNIFSYRKNLNAFYESIDDMISNYYKLYPNTINYYFEELVEPEEVTQWKFWVTDLNDFFIDVDLLKQLFEGDKKYKELQKKGGLLCPWCGNSSIDEFSFVPFMPEKETDGVVVCLKCKSTSPPGYVNDGLFIFLDKKLYGER